MFGFLGEYKWDKLIWQKLENVNRLVTMGKLKFFLDVLLWQTLEQLFYGELYTNFYEFIILLSKLVQSYNYFSLFEFYLFWERGEEG